MFNVFLTLEVLYIEFIKTILKLFIFFYFFDEKISHVQKHVKSKNQPAKQK